MGEIIAPQQEIFVATSITPYLIPDTYNVEPEYEAYLEEQFSIIEKITECAVTAGVRIDDYGRKNLEPHESIKGDFDAIKRAIASIIFLNLQSDNIEIEIGAVWERGIPIFFAKEDKTNMEPSRGFQGYYDYLISSGRAVEIGLPIDPDELGPLWANRHKTTTLHEDGLRAR